MCTVSQHQRRKPTAHKEEIYAKRFIVLGAAINLGPGSVGRGPILSGARCEVGRTPCTSSLHTPCQGGPGGAWWSRLWVRTVGMLCNPYDQCIWIEGGGGVAGAGRGHWGCRTSSLDLCTSLQQICCSCCFLVSSKSGYYVAKMFCFVFWLPQRSHRTFVKVTACS